jgi:hypothetical protein
MLFTMAALIGNWPRLGRAAKSQFPIRRQPDQVYKDRFTFSDTPAKCEFAVGHVRYNCRVPKRPCTNRAEWRLLPGKAAQRLSAHYQLGCDYGTPLITIFKASDGNEPIYLCEGHVSEIER